MRLVLAHVSKDWVMKMRRESINSLEAELLPIVSVKLGRMQPVAALFRRRDRPK